MNLRETYNRIAEDWHRDHQADDWWVRGTDAFVALLPPKGTVLDVGCGGGTKARYLVAKGLQVTGVDFSDNQIAIARREVPEASFQVADIYQIDLFPGEFDGILLQAVLLHIPKQDLPSVMSKVVAKMKVGGYLCSAVKGPKPGQPEEKVVTESDYGYSYERLFVYYSPAEMEAAFRAAGLAIIQSEVITSGSTDWVQVIAKK